jgi:hypothetical protein
MANPNPSPKRGKKGKSEVATLVQPLDNPAGIQDAEKLGRALEPAILDSAGCENLPTDRCVRAFCLEQAIKGLKDRPNVEVRGTGFWQIVEEYAEYIFTGKNLANTKVE